MSTTYELIFIHGIPFLADSLRNIYYYDPTVIIGTTTEFIQLGTFRDGDFQLFTDWKSRLESRLATWRGALLPSERGVPIARATKPSRAKRPSPRTTKTKSVANTEGGSASGGTGIEGIS